MKTIRRFELDVERFPAVVIETDDWGAAEVVPSEDLCETVSKLTPSGPANLKAQRSLKLFIKCLKNIRAGMDSIRS